MPLFSAKDASPDFFGAVTERVHHAHAGYGDAFGALAPPLTRNRCFWGLHRIVNFGDRPDRAAERQARCEFPGSKLGMEGRKRCRGIENTGTRATHELPLLQAGIFAQGSTGCWIDGPGRRVKASRADGLNLVPERRYVFAARGERGREPPFKFADLLRF